MLKKRELLWKTKYIFIKIVFEFEFEFEFAATEFRTRHCTLWIKSKTLNHPATEAYTIKYPLNCVFIPEKSYLHSTPLYWLYFLH
jgi:hypothetical protein